MTVAGFTDGFAAAAGSETGSAVFFTSWTFCKRKSEIEETKASNDSLSPLLGVTAARTDSN